jgi:hypothetical protein
MISLSSRSIAAVIAVQHRHRCLAAFDQQASVGIQTQLNTGCP